GEGLALQRNGTPRPAPRDGARSADVARTAERIETWLLEWLVARLGLDVADVSRDRPFAEFGVDSLTAVELSHELETEFKVPLPPIVAWNYPTPAALARYLAEQASGPRAADAPAKAANGAAHANGKSAATLDDRRLAELLKEVENLSDAEAARLLTEEQRR
ncbi:MAG: acyl carrier protein, partial [Pirellulales bacterium]